MCAQNQQTVLSEIDYLHNRLNVYIYEIGKVLKELGGKAKLRMHPSENPDWYAKFIDTKFFVIDQDKLSASLANSTLVIGPVSTLFIDAINFGVSYIVYEPVKNGDGLFGRKQPNFRW